MLHIIYIRHAMPCAVQGRATSPLGKHVLNGPPVAAIDLLFQLFFGEPFEVLKAELVFFQVDLTSHDARLHEKGLCAVLLEASNGSRLGIVQLMVTDWYMADKPGVHVYTASTSDDAVGSLRPG